MTTYIYLLELWKAQIFCIQYCAKFTRETTWPRPIMKLLNYVDQYQIDLGRLEVLSGAVLSKELTKLQKTYEETHATLFHGKSIADAFSDVAVRAKTLFSMFPL